MTTTALRPKDVAEFVRGMFEEDLHAKRVASLADATTGANRAGTLAIHSIGHGLASARGLNSKHSIKQVDRLLSNAGVDPWDLLAQWVPFVVGGRPEMIVAMDWTDFDSDDQSTIAIHTITNHGRATPLVWLTVPKEAIKGWRNFYEYLVLERLKEVMPNGTRVTILADRGFGDHKLYEKCRTLGFDFVVRFREGIMVAADGDRRCGKDWVLKTGRPLLLRGATVTNRKYQLPAVVCVKAPAMKESWCLATSHSDKPASEIVKLYGRRFTIEESFRDTKNLHFGLGLSATRIGDPKRRDRLLLIGALAMALLTLLGAAGESLGMDRMLNANTSKKRTHSLFRQGLLYYDQLPMMATEKLTPLHEAFVALLKQHLVFQAIFGPI
jgi:Transposase DDE domain